MEAIKKKLFQDIFNICEHSLIKHDFFLLHAGVYAALCEVEMYKTRHDVSFLQFNRMRKIIIVVFSFSGKSVIFVVVNMSVKASLLTLPGHG